MSENTRATVEGEPAQAVAHNRCGCNHWTTPACPERNCTWHGKRPVDRAQAAPTLALAERYAEAFAADACDQRDGHALSTPTRSSVARATLVAHLATQAVPAGQPQPTWGDVRAALIAECDHAALNDMRLPAPFGRVEGRIAVPEDNILAVIERFDASPPAGTAAAPRLTDEQIDPDT